MKTINEPLADARDMFAVHTMFRREFELMPGLVRAATAGDKQRATMVAGHIALVGGILNHHHSGEDSHIWPLLRERCPQECTAIVDVMEDQHRAIHTLLSQVLQEQESWHDSASPDTRHALARVIDRLIPVTNEHLGLEEECVVPLIEKHITEAEYAVLAQEQAAYIAPYELPEVFGMITYEGDPAVIDMIVAEMPAKVQPVIKDLAAAAYAAYATELYGTAAPPRMTGLSWRGCSVASHVATHRADAHTAGIASTWWSCRQGFRCGRGRRGSWDDRQSAPRSTGSWTLLAQVRAGRWSCTAKRARARRRCWTTWPGRRRIAGWPAPPVCNRRWSWRSRCCTSCAHRCWTTSRLSRRRRAMRYGPRSVCVPGRHRTASWSAWPF
jgi:hypothetical protein